MRNILKSCLVAAAFLLSATAALAQFSVGGGITPTSICGDSGHALAWNGTAYACQAITGGSAGAGGSNTQAQYNQTGALAGISGQTSDGTNTTFASGTLKLSGATSGTSVLSAPATGGGALTLPPGADTVAGIAAVQTFTNKNIDAGQLTGSVVCARLPALTGDVTSSAGSCATTAATVNANVGSFGDATHCAALTVNAKGLVTAASQSTSCPGGGGGGTPGGSTTQLQYNNAGAFGGISGATSNGTSVTLTSPTLVTPALGTPVSGVGTNLTGIPPAAVTSAQGNGTKFQLSTGTTTTNDCVKFDANGNTVDAGAACGSGGGAWNITDGTTTITGVASLTTGNGLVVGGTGTAATLGITNPDVTKSADYTVAAGDMGGQINLSGAHTLTIPAISGTVLANGMTVCLSDIGTGNWTISTTPTINGMTGSTLVPGSGGCLISNGTSLDFAPGMQLPSSTRLGGVITTALGSHNFATGISTSTGQLTGAQPACADISNAGTSCAVNTGTSGANIPLLNGANTWSGVQSVNSGDLSLNGSGSGATVLNAAATAGSTTATLPNNTGTVAELNLKQNWTAQQSNCVTPLTATSNTYTPDGTCNNYSLTLAATNTVANFSSTMVAGTSGVLVITQDGTGSRTIAWGSQYQGPGGSTTIQPGTAASSVSIIPYYMISSTVIAIGSGLASISH